MGHMGHMGHMGRETWGMGRSGDGVDQGAFLEYLQEHWPSGGALTIQEFRAITDGWENEIYSFRMIDHGKGVCEDLILRIYPGHDGVVKSRWEFDIMGLLRRTGFSVPEVHLLEPTGAFLQKPFMIMEKIDGPTLRDMLLDDLNCHLDYGGKLLDIFCQLLVDLHRWDWQGHRGKLASSIPKNQALAFQQELEKWSRVADHGFEPAFDWLSIQYSHMDWEPPCLTHGDFHPANIIMSWNDTPFVIDWGGSRFQDFRFDLAWTMLLMSTYGGKGLRDMILGRYQAISGKHVPNMECFEAAAALRRLISVYLSVTRGAEQLGMRPDAVTMMQSDLPHLERVYRVFQDRTATNLPVIEDFFAEMGLNRDSL